MMHTFTPYYILCVILFINNYFVNVVLFNRKQGDGLFLQTCEQVSKLYPKIKFEGMIVDNTCMQVLLSTVDFW